MGVVMPGKVLVIKTEDNVEKFAPLAGLVAPLVAGAKALGGAAMAGGRAVAGLATRAAQTPIGQKIGAAAKRVDDVANNPKVKAAAKAKEASDAHKQRQEMRAQEQLSGAKESADRAREEAGIATGEPMNLAWRLLKEDDLPDMSKFGLPVQRPTSITYADGVKKPIPYEYRGPKYEYRSPTNEREIRAEAEKQRRARLYEELMGEKRERFFERWVDGNYQPPEVSPTMNEVSPTMNEAGNNKFHPEHEPMSSDDMIAYLDEEYLGHTGSKEAEPMETYQDVMADTPEGRKKQTNIMGTTYDGEPTFNMIPLAGEGQPMVNPHAEIFRRSEPIDIAFQLLKERVSPEAKRHKLEYDKKYESTPERVKYREELNRERKKRGIYGHGGPDMSHTKDHRIVPEDPHTNRARHFREMGTLL